MDTKTLVLLAVLVGLAVVYFARRRNRLMHED
jgi:hypothetical protein